MTVTRPASASAGRTWLRPAPPCGTGTAAARAIAAAPQRRGGQRLARATAAAIAVAALVAAGVTGRAALTASIAMLGHLRWPWIPAMIAGELASMAAFAIMLRRLLAAGGASVGVRPMLATAYAANAVSVSVPLAGPELATAFTFHRFTRQGADAPLAGWSLLAGGVASSAAAALVVVGGGLASGKILVAAVAVPGGALAAAALAGVATATRRPRLRGALERPAAWTLRHGSRLLRRPADDPRQSIRAWAERLASLQLPASGWMTVTSLALANWLADAAVLAVSIRASGAAVPWHDFLLVYGSGIAAQSLNITPGGLGVAEGTLSLALVATGLRAGQALAAVLLYRLASFWLVASAGWLVFLWLRHHQPGGPKPASHERCHPLTTRRAIRPGGPPVSGRRPVPEPKLPGVPPRLGQDTAVVADAGTTYLPAALGTHELVLLHGQPGSAADWQLMAGRLPATLRTLAIDRPGYGTSPLPAGGFTAGGRAVLDDLDSRDIRRRGDVGPVRGGGLPAAPGGRPLTEQWLPVPDWPYEVSDLGRVRSVDRVLGNGQFCAGTVLKATRDSKGYYRVTLRDGARTATRRVHELVMLAHAGPRPAGMHILHKDDDQELNDRQSLRYGTQSENEREKRRRGKGKKKGRGRKGKIGRKGSPRGTSAGSPASLESQP